MLDSVCPGVDIWTLTDMGSPSLLLSLTNMTRGTRCKQNCVKKERQLRQTESNCALIHRHQGNYKNGNPGDISAKATLWKTGAPLQSPRLAADWTCRGVDCSTVELKLKYLFEKRKTIHAADADYPACRVKPQAGCS